MAHGNVPNSHAFYSSEDRLVDMESGEGTAKIILNKKAWKQNSLFMFYMHVRYIIDGQLE